MNTLKTQQKTSQLTVFGVIVATLVLLNIFFMTLTAGEVKTTDLLKKELIQLEQNAELISSSQQIYETYKNDIDVISGVFPTEALIPQFISTLESHIRASSDEYTFKFNAITPIRENTSLYLPMTISMKTDMNRLLIFLGSIEKLPYITHMTALSIKTPDGIGGRSEVIISLKIYVQNPFTQ